MKLELSAIRIDGGTQARAGIDQGVVSEYAEGVEGGDTFPPLTVFHDGTTYWLADGFHRYHAYSKLEAREVEADVRQGERRDAVLYSVGANATHGLRRTNDDKRRAVTVLLEDEEWQQWSNNEIAKRTGVSHTFVNRLRDSLETVSSQTTYNGYKSTERKGADGRTINTANIGKSQPPAPRLQPTYKLPLSPDEPEEDDRPPYDPYADDHSLTPAQPSEIIAISPEEAAEFLELASQPVPEETAETRMKEALRRDGYDEAQKVGKHLMALTDYSDGRLMEVINSQSGQLLGLPRLKQLLTAELERKTLEVVG